MANKLICYRCFEKFYPYHVWFRCENRNPKDHSRHCPFVEDSKLHTMLPNAFPGKGFWFGVKAVFSMPDKCKCPVCKTVSKKRICPSCHQDLLFESGKIEEHIIPIVGGPGSGKSHTFTVLIERCLKGGDVAIDFKLAVSHADQATLDVYNQKYKGPLIDMGREIPPNRPQDRSDDRLIFRINFERSSGKRRPVNLVFYDISGELLNTTDDITDAARFLYHASGIMYLVNPLHLPEIAKLIGDTTQVPILTPDVILSNIIKEIRKDKDLDPGDKIKIPIAICLSQSDRLNVPEMGLNGDIFTPHRNEGCFDEKDFSFMNSYIRETMLSWKGTSLSIVNIAEAEFAKVSYFAASALGNSPDYSGNIAEIKPVRLEHSFLWILSKLGIINKCKG